jgi:hypothetical protein
MIAPHGNLLTITTVQEDPSYLEPRMVSRVWEFDPYGGQEAINRGTCNTGNEIPTLDDAGRVPHYLPGQNKKKTTCCARTTSRRKRHGDLPTRCIPSTTRHSRTCTRRRPRAAGTAAGESSVKAYPERRQD